MQGIPIFFLTIFIHLRKICVFCFACAKMATWLIYMFPISTNFYFFHLKTITFVSLSSFLFLRHNFANYFWELPTPICLPHLFRCLLFQVISEIH